MLEIRFYGVRGSTPCSDESTMGVGGNTSCVTVSFGQESPIILDLGTGLRYLGLELINSGQIKFVGTALVSHIHWDHVQGIPFFKPLLHPESQLEVVGPEQDDGTLAEAVDRFISPPLFPVGLTQLPAKVTFNEISSGQLQIGSVSAMVAPLTHVGATNCYRLQSPDGGSVAYLSDHQQPVDGEVEAEIADFCRDVDVLIHDAQYSPDELAIRSDWGHSTPEYAVKVALESGAKRLVLFHHDPTHNDAWVAQARDDAQALAGQDLEVMFAYEGLVLSSGT